MTAINMGIFSEIANNKADCDLRNIDTNKTDIIIEYQKPTAENGYTWYRLFATNWVEQGGILPAYTSGEAHTETITLPVMMQDNNYIGFTTMTNNSNETAGFYNISIWDRTTTSFKCRQQQTPRFWRIEGRADMTGHEILPQASEGYVSPLELLKQVYPIGSVYIGTQSTCPLASLFGTWELVSNGKALWTGDGTNANTTIEAGLPNITGSFAGYELGRSGKVDTTGAFYEGAASSREGTSSNSGKAPTIYINASRSSSIYGKSSTVQPPAYVVNVWRRTV